MPCVKCFKLGISNTYDEGVCGKDWWPQDHKEKVHGYEMTIIVEMHMNWWWLDAPVDVTWRVRSVATVEFETNCAEWPDTQRVRSGVTGRVWSCKNLTVLWPDARLSPIGDDRTCPVSEVPLWNWTGRTVDASNQFPSRVRSDHLSSLTLVNPITVFGPQEDHVWSTKLKLRWLPVLTGRVRSRQRPCPVERKWLKQLRIMTQLEPSFFQLNFELHLSYLVLSLTSVHHT
jgi:hypothetical protein